MVSDPVGATNQEQTTLPFGTTITAETQAATNQRFTSYDRSDATGLDYAVNRTYNSGQGRFTTVDPIGMQAAHLTDPQSLNMFAYVRNNPVDIKDPLGLLFGNPFKAIWNGLKTVASGIGSAFSSFASWAWGGIERSARFIGRVATRVVSFVTRPIRALLGLRRRVERNTAKKGSGSSAPTPRKKPDRKLLLRSINNCIKNVFNIHKLNAFSITFVTPTTDGEIHLVSSGGKKKKYREVRSSTVFTRGKLTELWGDGTGPVLGVTLFPSTNTNFVASDVDSLPITKPLYRLSS